MPCRGRSNVVTATMRFGTGTVLKKNTGRPHAGVWLTPVLSTGTWDLLLALSVSARTALVLTLSLQPEMIVCIIGCQTNVMKGALCAPTLFRFPGLTQKQIEDAALFVAM